MKGEIPFRKIRRDNMKLTIYRAAGKGNAPENIYYPVSRTVSTQEDFLEIIAYDHVCSEFKHNRRSNDVPFP